MTAMLDIEHEKSGDVDVVRVRGTLDTLTAGALKREVEPMFAAARPRLVLDLSGVDLVDSSGVGALVGLFKRVRALHGDLRVASLRGQPRQIFGLLRLEQAFGIEETVEAATEKLRTA